MRQAAEVDVHAEGAQLLVELQGFPVKPVAAL